MTGREETALSVWGRRCLTVPIFLLLFVAAVSLLPLLVPLALACDLVRRRRLATLRCVAFLGMYLFYECAGILASTGVFLLSPLFGGRGSSRWIDVHWALESWWAGGLYRGTERIYGMTRVVEEEGEAGRGPALVLVRHASVGDTMIPAVYLSIRHGLRLRYVLKRELLWDPCLDIVGNRLPNYFVLRGAPDGAREIDGVVQLLHGLGPRDGVVIYPEGTRFTPAKRRTILERLESSGDPELAARARRLGHVLPPRLGGILALLEHNPGADVVFCAHTGFENAATFWQFWNGALTDQEIRVRLWRVPFAEVPKDREGRIDWLFAQWERVDAWVGSARPRAQDAA